MILVGGFLGAGKTTTMINAALRLEKAGERVVVITNDQGEGLVDTGVGNASGVRTGEVTGGCFCCRFDDLATTAVRLVREHEADVVIAEAVGSCTDLMSTVILPLRTYRGSEFEVAPLTVVIDPIRFGTLMSDERRVGERVGASDELAYLYRKQLEEADIVAVNKLDLLTDEDAANLCDEVSVRFPSAEVHAFSAVTGDRFGELLELWMSWDGLFSDRPPIDLDYDTYAEAEAQLAWLNASFTVVASKAAAFSPTDWLDLLLVTLRRQLLDRQAFIGHVKAQLATVDGVTIANLIDAAEPPNLRPPHSVVADRGSLLVNARVVIAPRELERILEEVIGVVNERNGTSTRVTEWSAFRPARPRPVHRLAFDGSSLPLD
jgi:Ni2+-binding GTPase involved in maturation of urease and hydrogenase